MRIVKTIINDVKMENGLEKCATICLKSGKVLRKQHRKHSGNEIKELESMRAYNYLGVVESHNIEHDVRRLRLILNIAKGKYKMQAVGTLVIHVLRYSFGIVS
jgi:hypothetical protein